jgi:acetyltransferase/esterase
MSFLEVPGARLYYEAIGNGPLLLLVPGASGSGDSFRGVVQHLAANYRVIIYDRRGFSRSQLHGAQDYQHRLASDADDVRQLIDHLSDGPATIFGASSGGIVALEVLTRHVTVVGTLIPFEPPVVRWLPDGQTWLDAFSDMYEFYRGAGVGPALQRFREQAFAEPDRQIMARAMDPSNPVALANATYWLEHELRQYPAVRLDFDVLRVHADRILPAAGLESHGTPVHRAIAALAGNLGRPLIELPSGHLGCISHPADFARELLRALALAKSRPL